MPKKQTRRKIEARPTVVKRGVRGIYEVLWYDTGAGEVRSLVNRTIVAKYTPGLGWEDRGRLPDDVREYAQQIASSESAGRSEPESKKSHAQINREVDDILTRENVRSAEDMRHYHVGHAGSCGTSACLAQAEREEQVAYQPPVHRHKDPIPGISAWNMFAGGLSAAPGKHSYSLNVPEGEYHVNPISSPRGRHRGYSLRFSARQPPRGGHGGLWHDLGMHRSPAQAAVTARKHYAASY